MNLTNNLKFKIIHKIIIISAFIVLIKGLEMPFR